MSRLYVRVTSYIKTFQHEVTHFQGVCEHLRSNIFCEKYLKYLYIIALIFDALYRKLHVRTYLLTNKQIIIYLLEN